MANEPKGPRDDDDFVSKIVKDPANPPDTLLLSGYVGASPEERHTRLYLNPELSDYVDIPNDAILHTAQMPSEQGTLRGSYVWIKRDAEVTHAPVTVAKRRATFLEGRMQRAFAAQTQAGMTAGVAQNALITAPSLCVGGCPTQIYLTCQHTIGGGILCRPTIVIQQCPSHGAVFCPITRMDPCLHTVRIIECGQTLPLHCYQTLDTCTPIICGGGQSLPVCPTFGACPSIACGPGGGDVVQPVAPVGFAPVTFRPDCSYSSQVPRQCPTNAPVVCPTEYPIRCGGTRVCW